MKQAMKSRRTVAAITMACIGAVPLAGAALVATAGSASAMPENGWCYEEVKQKDGSFKTVKKACP